METFWITRKPEDFPYPAEAVDPALAALVMDVPVRLIFVGDGTAWLNGGVGTRVMGQLEFFDDVELIATGVGPGTFAGHPIRWFEPNDTINLQGDTVHMETSVGAAPPQARASLLSDIENLIEIAEQNDVRIWYRP